ncbi:MAG: chitinase C-terminal domain-containing protein, partial [Psychrobium sp.]|nr:chitinase C-terminal domain-containing protein [Psychrobium sp.]
IGVPYYTRGWQGVTGGTHGLWGTAALPDQNDCDAGTGTGSKNQCGYGALGINNIWHDKNSKGFEMGAGSNPMWHAKNLEQQISGSYLSSYGLDSVTDPADRLTGQYSRYYDPIMVAPWLWNEQTKTFLSIEDEQSIDVKAQYVIDQGLGGIMFWELAGDYDWDSARSEYFMGSNLTSRIYDKFVNATPYGNQRSDIVVPGQSLDIEVAIAGFKLGDANYPLNPQLLLTNHSGQRIPGGTVFEFDVPTSIPDTITDQSGVGLSVISSGRNASGNNVGGLDNHFHRIRFTLKNYQSISDGATFEIKLNYYLPMPMPSNWTISVGEQSFALKQEQPQLSAGTITDSGGDKGENSGELCSEQNIDVSAYQTYPSWPAGGAHANGGDRLMYLTTLYQAKWWTNSIPGSDGSWQVVCQ